jgi:rubredoxin
MLTPDDGRNDGMLTNYINNPNTWRDEKDRCLFDTMSKCLKNGNRNVSLAEKYSIIPNAVYYDLILPCNSIKRKEYFAEFCSISQHCDLIFFDPDNGFEVKSSCPGTKNSNKYLYWEELSYFYKMDKSF